MDKGFRFLLCSALLPVLNNFSLDSFNLNFTFERGISILAYLKSFLLEKYITLPCHMLISLFFPKICSVFKVFLIAKT